MSDPFLIDRADGVSGHYCVARLKDDKGTHEFFNEPQENVPVGCGCWSASGTVYFGLKQASHKLLEVFVAVMCKRLDGKKW